MGLQNTRLTMKKSGGTPVITIHDIEINIYCVCDYQVYDDTRHLLKEQGVFIPSNKCSLLIGWETIANKDKQSNSTLLCYLMRVIN